MFNWMKPKKKEAPIATRSDSNRSPAEPPTPVVPEISAAELRALLKSPTPPLVLDVREAYELTADGLIPGSVHIPMRFIPNRLSELPRDRPIVAYCGVGARSYYVAEFLLKQGYGEVKNLRGGIIAWQAANFGK